jgi:hypothetical protein
MTRSGGNETVTLASHRFFCRSYRRVIHRKRIQQKHQLGDEILQGHIKRENNYLSEDEKQKEYEEK